MPNRPERSTYVRVTLAAGTDLQNALKNVPNRAARLVELATMGLALQRASAASSGGGIHLQSDPPPASAPHSCTHVQTCGLTGQPDDAAGALADHPLEHCTTSPDVGPVRRWRARQGQ